MRFRHLVFDLRYFNIGGDISIELTSSKLELGQFKFLETLLLVAPISRKIDSLGIRNLSTLYSIPIFLGNIFFSWEGSESKTRNKALVQMLVFTIQAKFFPDLKKVIFSLD